MRAACVEFCGRKGTERVDEECAWDRRSSDPHGATKADCESHVILGKSCSPNDTNSQMLTALSILICPYSSLDHHSSSP